MVLTNLESRSNLYHAYFYIESGAIDFKEFCILMLKHYKHDDEAKMKDAFKRIDSDGSGCIDFKELKRVMTNLGLQAVVSDDVITDLIKVADIDGDGVIEYEGRL